MFKKLLSIFTTVCIICGILMPLTLYANAADNEYYTVDFDGSTLNFAGMYSGWERSDGTYKDFISGSLAKGEGVEGNGYKIEYSQVSYYAGRLFFSFPSNFEFTKDINQIEFDIKGTGSLYLYLMEGMVQNSDDTVTFDSDYSKKITFDTGDEWEHITLSVYDIVKSSGAYPDITKVNGISFTPPGGGYDQNKLNTADMEQLLKAVKTGSAIIDNIKFSSAGEAPDLSDGTFVADFDTVGFGSGGQKWNGAVKYDENNNVVYNDYVSCTTQSGIGVNGSKGFKITYKQATYYGGEQFIAKPTNWDLNYDLKCIEFDAKGKATFNMNLETRRVVNGDRYSKKFRIDTTNAPDDGWQHFKIPLSEFTREVNGEVISIPVKDLVGFSITGPGGKYDDKKINEYTVEELEAAAKTGEVVIDNFEVTTDDSNLAEPGRVIFKVDFDDSDFEDTNIFSGWSCAENGYSDYIKQSTAEGKEGNALRIDYKQATYFCGEIFKSFNSDWQLHDDLRSVEFDIKGNGSVNLNLKEGSVTDGVRFGTVITADNENDWTHVVIPLEQFRNNGVSVNPLNISGITFSRTGGSVDQDEMSGFTGEELEEMADKGYIIIDNFEITMKEPVMEYTYTVTNGEAKITGSRELLSGSVILPDTLGGYPVTSIGDYAFSGCENITDITIPEKVTSIGTDVFFGCISLTDINVSSDNPNYSSYDGVLFNKDMTEIIKYPEGRKSESYTIPDCTVSIGDSAFKSCKNLKSIIIPDNITIIGPYAFLMCTGLTKVTLPAGTAIIDTGAFSGCLGLRDVYYKGSSDEKNSIDIGINNTFLTDAAWHYGRLYGGKANIESIEYTGKVISANVSFSNIGSDAGVYLAVYNDEDILTALIFEPINAANGSINMQKNAALDEGRSYTVKLMIWNSTMSPMAVYDSTKLY